MSTLDCISKNKLEADLELSLPITQTCYLVGGELKEWKGNYEQVISPIYYQDNDVKSDVIGSYPSMTAVESLEVLEAACRAYDNGKGVWAQASIEYRIQQILVFVEQMRKKRSEIVNLLMLEIGKNKNDSQKEFDRTIDYIIDTIEALKDIDRVSSRFILHQGIIAQVRRSPLGVVLCMGPFNYPLNETFATLIPALIMGNSIIFKPPKLGVLLHKPLLELFKNSFPAGVVNTVYGEGAKVVAPLMESGKIDCLAFIGSSKVADILKKQHPKPHRLRCVLGLEAKNPAIILSDANIDIAVNECVTGALSFNGQRCTALKIIFVHKDISQIFIDKFCEKIEKLKVGLPWENADITPLPEPNKPEVLKQLVDDALQRGATLVNTSGAKIDNKLFYPAVVFPVSDKMQLYHVEQFGPVIPIVPFEKVTEALDYIINSNYGQQVSVFSSDSTDLSALIDVLVNQVCRVNVNCQCQRGPDILPFTGRKDSAEGTLSVSDALRVFSIRTLVSFKENDTNKKIIKEIIHDHKSKFLNTDFII